MADTTVHVVISGRVQGVWFRGWTEREAAAREITGWVRNRHDGTVEAVFQGAQEDVTAMIEGCWRGPPAAKVTDVQVQKTELTDLPNFRPLPTI